MRLALCSLAALALPLALANSGLRFNRTPSIPVGLYYATSDQSAPYVEFCLPEAVAVTAIRAGLTAGRGECPGGILPLVKSVVVATERAPFEYSADGITLAGRLIPNTKPKARSSAGVALAHYPFGHYTSGVWAIGSNKDSFDSRYFGPIDPKSVRAHVRPLLVW